MRKLKEIIGNIRTKYFIWKSQHAWKGDASTGPIQSLGVMFESKDDMDVFILQNIAQPPFDLFIGTVCFRGDKKLEEDYITRIFNITGSLLKANDHRRKYLESEKKLLKDFKKDSLKNPNKHLDLTSNPVELNNEIDACLAQLKAALDSLAGTLTPLFGFQLDAWQKQAKKNHIIKNSGYRIIEAFSKAQEPLRSNSSNLRDYLEKNSPWLTYLAILRDMPMHRGGSQNISSLVFDHAKKMVIPQRIHHPEKQIEDVGDFLTRTVTELSRFISNVMLATIQLKGFVDMIPFRNDNNNPPKYFWGTPELIKAEKEKGSK